MYNTQKSNLQERTITLVNVEDTGNQIKITDEKNDFYSFFKDKRSGGATQAYVDLQGFSLNQQVNIVFEERDGTNGGKFRNVARIKPAGGEVTTTPTSETPTKPVDTRFQFNRPAPVMAPTPATPAAPTMHKAATLPRDLSITAQAFAKSLLESHQATPADLVNPNWWATVIFPAIVAMVQGGSAVVADDDINVEDIPF